MIVALAACFCCLLWGSAPACIKLGYQLLSISNSDLGSILLFAGLRFALAGLLVLILDMIRHKTWISVSSDMARPVLTLSIFQTSGQYFLYYVGLSLTSGTHGSIISGLSAFLSLLVAVYLFKSETMTSLKLIGCILGFFGILSMNVNGGGMITSLMYLGDVFVMGSQLCSALSASFIKRYTSKFSAVTLSGTQFFVGGITLILIGLILGGHISLSFRGMLLILYLAMVSAIAYTLWGILLSYNPVSVVGVFGCLIPVSGVLFSSIVLKESAFGIETWLALLLICIGIIMVTKKENC